MSEERFRYSREDMKTIDKAWGKKYCVTDNAYYATAKAMELEELRHG